MPPILTAVRALIFTLGATNMFGQTNKTVVPSSLGIAKSFTANLTQVAATYDLCTATGGDVMIDVYNLAFYMATAGATFTSVSVQSNQTAPFVLLSSAEGAVANLTAQKHVVRTIPSSAGFILKSGQKIQYTIAGPTGSGSMEVSLSFKPLSLGATLA